MPQIWKVTTACQVRLDRRGRVELFIYNSKQHQSNVFNHWYVFFFHGDIELQRVRSDGNSLLWFSFRLLLKSRAYCSVEDYSPSQSPTKTSYICPSGTGVFLFLVLLSFTPVASNSFSFPSLRSSYTATLSSTVTVTVYTRETATSYLAIHVPEILQKSFYYSLVLLMKLMLLRPAQMLIGSHLLLAPGVLLGKLFLLGHPQRLMGKHVLLALGVLLRKPLLLGPAQKLVGPHMMLLAPGLFRNVAFWRFVLNQIMDGKKLCHRVVTNHKNFP